MKSKAAVFGLLLAASLANAQTQAMPLDKPTVTGVVSSVSGHIVKVANDTVAIDASAAEIVDTADAKVSFAAITPGSLIVATVKSDDVAANAPILATRIIAMSKSVEVSLTGALTAIDVAHNTFTILGKTVQVTPQTTYYGPGYDGVTRGVADIERNHLAIVQARPGNTQSLVAKSVFLVSASVELQNLIHGTVKSIAANAWRINDVNVIVMPDITKIVGNPKVGDSVDVRGRYDLSNKPVALTITKSKR
jgi:hypothetical protein